LKRAVEFPDAHTIASGLRVPKAIGDFLILKILRQSNRGAISIDDEEMIRVGREVVQAKASSLLLKLPPASPLLSRSGPQAKFIPANAW
jgi:threonine synthase